MQDTVVLPNPTDQDVLELMRIHSLSGMPEFISFSDAGYPPRFCHVAAKHAAMTNSGKRVHGRAFWRFVHDYGDGRVSEVLVAEHHSVLEIAGTLVDVTPPAHDPNRILFLRDDSANIVSINGTNMMRTDLTNIEEARFLFRGEPIDVSQLAMPEDIRSGAETYAAQIGFRMSDYPTDALHG
ncbi:hypothetical protein [Rhizobium sp. Rhizsp82]|uniref:hypothetical protein n=1 Tax=Rhizobium sp. Rhizsp82 TaxID=3243057 RepID=UPI0039B56642